MNGFLVSAEFAARARLTPASFTRQLEMPFPHQVGLLLNRRTGSLQDEVNGFWEVLTGQPLATGVSCAALCKARQELNPDAFLALNERLLEAFAQAFPLPRWHGLGVLAADGSTPRLPLGLEARRQCHLFQIPTAPIPVHLVRVILANDETAVLATSL